MLGRADGTQLSIAIDDGKRQGIQRQAAIDVVGEPRFGQRSCMGSINTQRGQILLIRSLDHFGDTRAVAPHRLRPPTENAPHQATGTDGVFKREVPV